MNKNCIPVLVCSSSKIADWFCYNRQRIKFVAKPHLVPKDGFIYYKPDDPVPGENKTWRNLVLNGQNDPNLNLIKAYRLYKPKIAPSIYEDFYEKFGNSFYILSAGWGIIRADFRIPAYNITFSTAKNVPEYARRSVNDVWPDINHLKEDIDNGKYAPDSKIILFAGKDYLLHFRRMTQAIPYKKKILVYTNDKSKNGKVIQDGRFVYEDYFTPMKTNWQYEAAANFLKK